MQTTTHPEVNNLVSLRDFEDNKIEAQRDYLDAKITAQREFFEARIAALEKATAVARDSMDKRLDAMNEFRASLKDQAALMMTRTEFETKHQSFGIEIDALKQAAAKQQGSASRASVTQTQIVAYVGIAIAIISIIMRLLGM